MDKEAQNKVACTSRQRADRCLKKGNPGRAFSHFLVALQLNPAWKPDLKHVFASTLCAWGRILESKGRFADLFTCYEQAIDTFSDNEEVLNNLGAHLFRMGHLHEASNFFHQALDVNCCFLPAHRNLESVSNLLVERWHFRMLNDSRRNKAYREAIMKKVQQGFDTVLDIGTGTGILSLFAIEGGARRVYACDSSSTMINIARDVMEENNATARVKLINKLSNNLTIPDDIPNRVSLVVTETLDAGLLGENILQSLVHAWNSLLLPPADKQNKRTGMIIPFGATIWLAPIECMEIARRSRLLHNDSRPGNHLEDNEDIMDMQKINFFLIQDEPYDTYNFSKIRGMYRFLTPPNQTLHIDFNNCKEMTSHLNGTHEGYEFIARSDKPGRIDGVVAWFELQLDEDISLSSSPLETENKAECWDQTVFPLQEPIYVDVGQELQMRVACTEGRLTVSMKVISSATKNKMPSAPLSNKQTQKGVLPPVSKYNDNLANLDLHQLGSPSGDRGRFLPVSEEILMFLNDYKLIDTLNETAISILGPRNMQTAWKILDLSPFPFLGLTLLKVLTRIQTGSAKWDQMVCVVKDSRDEAAIRHVAEVNGIDNAHIECVQEEQFEDILDTKSQFDVIMVHLVNSRGELKESYINYLQTFRKMLKQNGVLLPMNLIMFCHVVSCPWLSEVSRVINAERVCGYKIAEFINTYQVSEHLDFWLDMIDHELLTEDEIEALNIPIERLSKTVETPLTIQLKVPIFKSGHANSIVYWFRIQMFGEEEFVETGTMDSYANHSAILVNPKCKVTADETVELVLTCHQGLIHAGLHHIEE